MTYEEIESLVESGDIEVMIQEVINDKIHFLICDHRRTVEEGEVYEVVI